MNLRNRSIAPPTSLLCTMSPASAELLDDVAHKGVDALRAGWAEQVDLLGREVLTPEDPRPQRVVDVVIDVGDAVDELDDPALQRGRLVAAGVVDDPVPHLVREVEAVAVALESVDDAQGVDVVLEAPATAVPQCGVERLLAGVAERGVSEVMPEADRLGQILVEPSALATVRAIPHASRVWVSRVL